MSFTVKANCQNGSQLIHRRKSPEAALKKARELMKTCYEVHIITSEGVTMHHRNSEIFHGRLVSCGLFVKPNLSPRRLSGVRIAGTNRLSALGRRFRRPYACANPSCRRAACDGSGRRRCAFGGCGWLWRPSGGRPLRHGGGCRPDVPRRFRCRHPRDCRFAATEKRLKSAKLLPL